MIRNATAHRIIEHMCEHGHAGKHKEWKESIYLVAAVSNWDDRYLAEFEALSILA